VEGNEEVKPESTNVGRNLDGTFGPGHKFSVGNSGRPKGIGFNALMRHILEESIDGKRTKREALVDKAIERAVEQSSDYVLMKLIESLNDEPKQVELIVRRAVLRVNKSAEPIGVNRFAEQNGNGNGNGHSGGNGHAG
jgi:hypothetical protein